MHFLLLSSYNISRKKTKHIKKLILGGNKMNYYTENDLLWLAIEMPMERGEEGYEYYERDLTPEEQWELIEQPMERGE